MNGPCVGSNGPCVGSNGPCVGSNGHCVGSNGPCVGSNGLELRTSDLLKTAVGNRSNFTSYHNVLWEKVITEGAIVKVDLIKCLFCQLYDFTLVVASIFVLADDLLTHAEVSHGCFITLQRKREITHHSSNKYEGCSQKGCTKNIITITVPFYISSE